MAEKSYINPRLLHELAWLYFEWPGAACEGCCARCDKAVGQKGVCL